jgi:hypothetical protein
MAIILENVPVFLNTDTVCLQEDALHLIAIF